MAHGWPLRGPWVALGWPKGGPIPNPIGRGSQPGEFCWVFCLIASCQLLAACFQRPSTALFSALERISKFTIYSPLKSMKKASNSFPVTLSTRVRFSAFIKELSGLRIQDRKPACSLPFPFTHHTVGAPSFASCEIGYTNRSGCGRKGWVNKTSNPNGHIKISPCLKDDVAGLENRLR
jgi:hypothetical protein